MTVPANAARLVDSDGIRIASNLRRTPTANKAPAIHRPTEIGTTFAVAHAVKKISTVVEIIDELGSVGKYESVATERASQLGAYAAEILRVFGHPQLGPIVIGTDNSANLTLSLGTATPGKRKGLPTVPPGRGPGARSRVLLPELGCVQRRPMTDGNGPTSPTQAISPTRCVLGQIGRGAREACQATPLVQ